LLLIAAVVLAIFAYGSVSAMLGTLLPSLHLSGAESGTVAFGQSAGLLLASLAAGPVIDNFGKKPVLVCGLFLMSFSLWILPNVQSSTPLTLLLFTTGLGGGAMVIAANGLVSSIGAERRAALLSFTNVFFGLGLIATPWVSTLVNNDPKQLCLLAASLATLTLAVHAAIRIPTAQGQTAGGFQWNEARKLVASPIVWILALSQFLYVACEVGVSNWLSSYLMQKGIPQDDALNIMAWRFGLGLLLGRVAAAPLMLRVKPRLVLLGATLAMTATTWWMLQAANPGLAVFCAGVAMAPVFPATMGILGDVFPKATSNAMSLTVTFGWLGLLTSSPLIGWIAGSDKSNLPAALLLFPASALAMVVLHLTLRPYLIRLQQQQDPA
jgi:fucose permease